jgi:two-component system, NarL family, response regulator DevR
MPHGCSTTPLSTLDVLVVDDDPSIRALATTVLKVDERFRHIETAPDITTGLARAREQRPDILLVDHRLPDGLGLTALPDFRAMLADAYLVLWSADMNADLAEEGIAAGANRCLSKLTRITSLPDLLFADATTTADHQLCA